MDQSNKIDSPDEDRDENSQSVEKKSVERPDTKPEGERSAYESTISSTLGNLDPGSIHLDHTAEKEDLRELEARVGTFVSKYKITKLLGQGGMGVVYAAHDSIIGREVAIKFLSAKAAGNETSLRRFVQEARAVGQLQHPNVVALFDVDQADGMWYLVMEKVDGGTASDLIENNGALSWKKAARIIADACRGLIVAHEKNLIHRDIKPDNIMLAGDGTAKVSDFGLAKMENTDTPTLTQQHQVLGTPHYMSPEQCRSSQVDARSDIYSLGATFYDLLTGSPPYAKSTDVMQIMYAQCHEPPPDPAELAPDLPPLCRGIIEQAMAKEPQDRYQSAAEMLEDLEVLLDDHTESGSFRRSSQRLSRVSGSRSGITSAEELQGSSKRWRNTYLWGLVALFTVLVILTPVVLHYWQKNENVVDVGPPVVASGESSGKAAPILAAAPIPQGEPIKIGILHSLSGTMAVSESGVVDAALLAIEELNQRGGVLGRPVEGIVADGRSNDDIFRQEAERLIKEEQVVTLFGCWTSSSRKQVKSIVEENDHLLIYPVQSEGMEQSPNIIYTGASPNQQIIPAVGWAYAFLKKRRFYFIGSDYVFPRAAGAIIKDELQEMGVELVGEKYVPLGQVDFKDIVQDIVDSKADMILNTINGQSNTSFFYDLRAAGVTSSEVPTISFSIAEPELRNLDVKKLNGDYAAWSYFQALDSAANKDFVQKFQKKYNATRPISDPMEAGYFSVLLWAQAVEQAGEADVSKIRTSIRGQTLAAPEGEVKIDDETGHTWKAVRIGQIGEDGNFSVVWSSPNPQEPEPFPDSRTREQWEKFLRELYDQWGGHWVAPAP